MVGEWGEEGDYRSSKSEIHWNCYQIESKRCNEMWDSKIMTRFPCSGTGSWGNGTIPENKGHKKMGKSWKSLMRSLALEC